MKQPPIKTILVVYMKPETPAAEKTLEIVQEALLATKKFQVEIRERNHVDYRCCWKKDIIITIGGDGTFLRVTQFNTTALMFGVNPDPSQKVGFFTRATAKDFRQKLQKIAKGNFKVLELTRLQAMIDGKRIEPALNEVYFGNELSYKMCRYTVELGKKKEMQRSSGMLISTGSGSYAWHKSAGGKPFPPIARKFAYLVREPYHRNKHYQLEHGFVGEEGMLKITSLNDENIVVVDALSQEYPLRKGNVLTVTLSSSPVRFVDV